MLPRGSYINFHAAYSLLNEMKKRDEIQSYSYAFIAIKEHGCLIQFIFILHVLSISHCFIMLVFLFIFFILRENVMLSPCTYDVVWL